MRVDIRHRFEGATLQQIEALYLLDDPFNRDTFERMGYARKVVTRTLEGDALTRVLHLCPHKPLPAPFSALVPNGVFHIIEQITYDFGAHRGTWRTTPSVLGTKFRAEGPIAIEEQDGAVTFRLEGDVSAQLSLLSRRAERQAVATAEQQHEALARAVRERLATSRGAASYATAPA